MNPYGIILATLVLIAIAAYITRGWALPAPLEALNALGVGLLFAVVVSVFNLGTVGALLVMTLLALIGVGLSLWLGPNGITFDSPWPRR